MLASSAMSAFTRQNQDRRRLFSEARATPPLMSGTMHSRCSISSPENDSLRGG